MLFLGLLLLLIGCSNTATAPSSRIVNGTNSFFGEFPYIVSLRSSGIHQCGASIINSEWILTAAHCVVYNPPSDFSIQHGVTEIDQHGPNIVNVSEIIAHENFSSMTVENDIALVKLSQQLTFDHLTKPIKLPKQYQFTKESSDAISIGWGLNATGGVLQTHLQKVHLFILSDEVCSERYNGRTFPSNICAGVNGGGKGPCSMDSGGPLLVNGHQVGVVSWAQTPCTIAPFPSVFTKVSYYIDWIKAQTGLRL